MLDFTPITTGIPLLDKGVIAAIGALIFLNWLCQILAHFFPATTPFGKFVSVLAGNAGKALAVLQRPAVGSGDPTTATLKPAATDTQLAPPPPPTITTIKLTILFLSVGSALLGSACATGWVAAEQASPACYNISQSFPDLENEIKTCVTDVTQSNPIGCAEAVLANAGINKEAALCVYETVQNEIAHPHGGEVVFVPDAGTPASPLAAAVALNVNQTQALQNLEILKARVAKTGK